MGNQLVQDLQGLKRVLERNDENMLNDVVAYAKNIGLNIQNMGKSITNQFTPAQSSKRQIEAAELYASKLRNPVRKQQIAAAIAKLRNESSQLLDAIKAFLARYYSTNLSPT